MADNDLAPEARARQLIDAQLVAAGWHVCDRSEIDLVGHQGLAVREVPMAEGHGRVDYLLFLDKKVVGGIEANRCHLQPSANSTNIIHRRTRRPASPERFSLRPCLLSSQDIDSLCRRELQSVTKVTCTACAHRGLSSLISNRTQART